MTIWILISWERKEVIEVFNNKMDAESNVEYYAKSLEDDNIKIIEQYVKDNDE